MAVKSEMFYTFYPTQFDEAFQAEEEDAIELIATVKRVGRSFARKILDDLGSEVK